jgi:hypothetical protein
MTSSPFFPLIDVSQFLRSFCCDAPVGQRHEPEYDLFPVICVRCLEGLGAPSSEEIEAIKECV